MINYLWSIFIIVGIIYGIINDVNITDVILSSCTNITDIILKLLPIICLWMGVMNVAEKSGLVNILSRKISPIVRFLFPEIKKDSPSVSYISASILMNFLGMGNAATPFGLKAMEEMQKENKNKNVASNSMITFLIITTASMTIFPSSVIALRASKGSSNPSGIITYSLISSFLALFISLTINKIIISLSKRR